MYMPACFVVCIEFSGSVLTFIYYQSIGMLRHSFTHIIIIVTLIPHSTPVSGSVQTCNTVCDYPPYIGKEVYFKHRLVCQLVAVISYLNCEFSQLSQVKLYSCEHFISIQIVVISVPRWPPFIFYLFFFCSFPNLHSVVVN